MSDDNVVEIDFDEETESQIVNTPSTEINDGQASASNTLNIAVIGTNAIAKSVGIMFATNNSRSQIVVNEYDSIDDSLENTAQQLYYVCLDAKLNKDDFDDANIIDACLKISNQTRSTIVLKTTVPWDTIERILSGVNEERFIYAPEEASDDDIREVLRSQLNLVGGSTKGIQAYSRLISGGSMLDRKMIMASHFDIACIKTGIVGMRAVTQTFYNQLYDYVQSTGTGNYNIVKKTLSTIKEEKLLTIPTFIRAQKEEGLSYKKSKAFSGEFQNTDAKIFSSMTDKFPLLDECINYKTLKD